MGTNAENWQQSNEVTFTMAQDEKWVQKRFEIIGPPTSAAMDIYNGSRGSMIFLKVMTRI